WAALIPRFFFSSRRRHTRSKRDWSSDVCSSDLSWCGPCFGQGPDALHKGERAITSFNRNWQNRMGVGGEGYLASPAVVAASALEIGRASCRERGWVRVGAGAADGERGDRVGT